MAYSKAITSKWHMEIKNLKKKKTLLIYVDTTFCNPHLTSHGGKRAISPWR